MIVQVIGTFALVFTAGGFAAAGYWLAGEARRLRDGPTAYLSAFCWATVVVVAFGIVSLLR